MSKIRHYSEQHGWGGAKIHLRFYDKKKKNVESLLRLLGEIALPPEVDFSVERTPFHESFENAIPSLKEPRAAKLLFIDQFGVKELTDDIFRKLTYLPTTDFLFFIASHTLHRFAEHPVIKQKIKRPNDSYDIHRATFEYYENLEGINPQVYLAPFTIKKGSNFYGLIFGSQHPLGMHKFLKVAWDKDKITGEANFDIDKTDIREEAPFLELEEFKPNKVRKFAEELEMAIRNGGIQNEQNLLVFCIRNGFTGSHAEPVLKKLKQEGVIELNFRVPQDKNLKTPRKVRLLVPPK